MLNQEREAVRGGAGRPLMPFLFATGIENSYPTILGPDGTTVRVDEMAKTGHYERWREDFGLVRELGLDYLRWGPPYYRVHQGPDRYDWSYADEALAELRRLGITPIVDLCHFGVPDWIGDFQNPDWPELFAAYAAAFAARYPWVRLYTPVNEIFVAATFSAQIGWWNERLSSDQAFVTALKHLVRANLLAEEAILSERARGGGDLLHPERVHGVLPPREAVSGRAGRLPQPEALPFARLLLWRRRARLHVPLSHGKRAQS